MADESDLIGIRMRLRRTKTVAELKVLSDDLASGGALDELFVTSQSFEGASHSGLENVRKRDLLRVVEEILAESGEVPKTGGRQLFSHVDFGGQPFRG
jgi:hypothetical protein